MEKEFVNYEQSVALKELGFDEPCFRYVYIGDTGNNCHHYIEVEPSKGENFNVKPLCISQPTFSQAFRWFREKYGLYSYIKFDNIFREYSYTINDEFRIGISTYEEAELACLIKLIEIVKNSK
jgi:hypothetical protein